MRTLSLGEAAAIAAPEGCWIFANMRVTNYGGDWLNLGALAVGTETLEFFNEATIEDDIDRNTLSMSAQFAREIGNHSLVPFRTTSDVNNYGGDYQPALDLARRWDLWVAIVPIGTVPVNADYREHARGWIDRIDVSGDPAVITIQGRGEEADLIEDRIIWGDTSGVPISAANPVVYDAGLVGDVIQQILDKQRGAGVIPLTIDASVDPTAAINGWNQEEEVGLFDLITHVASLRGMNVRYRYDASDVRTLTLFTPNRNPVTPDWSLDEGPRGYEKLDVGIDIAPVRNYVVVQYVDDSFGTQVVTSPASPLSPSISRYKKRTLPINLSSTTQVTTQEAAEALADAIRADLEFPILEQSMQATGYWFAELWDYVEFEENGIHYDENQFGGVVALSQRYANAMLKTAGRFKAKPAGRYRGWLDFGPAAPRVPFTAGVTSQSATFKEEVFGAVTINRIDFTCTVNDYTQSIEVWVYDTPDFSGTLYDYQSYSASSATPVSGTLNGMSGLPRDVTYYLKIVPYSGPESAGPTGTAGPFVTANTSNLPAFVDSPSASFDLSVPGEVKVNVPGVAGSDPDTIGAAIAAAKTVPFFDYGSDAEVLEDIPAAETEILRADGATSFQRAAMLAGMGAFRIIGNVTDTDAADEKIRAGYRTLGGSWVNLATPELTLDVIGPVRSDWEPMPAGMAADVDLRPLTVGGDDTHTVKLSSLAIECSPTTRAGGGTTPGGGGGGAGCGVVLATVWDDNFDCGTVIDTTGARFTGANAWTEFGLGVPYAGGVLSSDQLVMSVTSTGAWNPVGAEQTLPGGDWTFETDCSLNGPGFAPAVGIRLVETATSKDFHACYCDVFGFLAAAGDGSSMGAYGVASVGALSGKLEIARISGNLRVRYDSGSGWVTLVAALAQTTPFTTAPDKIQVFHAARRNGGGDISYHEYFHRTA